LVAGVVEFVVLGSKYFVAQNTMLVPVMYGAVLAPLAIASIFLIASPSTANLRPTRGI